MSSGDLMKINHGHFQEKPLEDHLDISQLVIPFSRLFKKYVTPDIYSGTEKIPFKARDLEFKMILRQEFPNTLKVEFKVFKSVIKFPSF